MEWILNLIAIAIFFIVRYGNRKDKSSKLSLSFWLNDNWNQLTAIILFDLGLMLLRGKDGFNISFEKITWLPEWVQMSGDFATAFMIGLFGAWAAYEGYKKLFIRKG